MTAARARRVALLPAFGLGAITVSFMQALVVPAIDGIARALDVSPATAGWAVTVNLLACAVLTPLLGRVGDLHGKRTVLLWALGACLAGSLLAATTTSLPLLLLARVLQGASGGIFPLAVGIIRDEVAEERVTRATALVSGMLSLGAGVGLVLTGVLTHGGGDYHRIFWLAAGVSAVALGALAWTVPARPRHLAGRLDVVGALILAAGLMALLLGLSEASRWGAGSPATIGCVVAGLGVLAGWLAWERRVPEPLVDPVMLARRGVLVTNLAGLFVGLANFGCVLGVTRLVQVPHVPGGYGFGTSVLSTALVYLLPATLCSAVAAPLGGELVHRVGGRRALLSSSTMAAVGFVGLALVHQHRGPVIVWAMLVLCSVSIAYAAIPALLAEEIDPDHTAVANSINSVARWIGGALASAMVVSVLAADRVPPELAFVAVFLVVAAGCLASAVLVARGLPRADRALVAA
ncbi:MAG: rane transport protein [Conexibacter sp.]|nr:rane transport protein [Conexibacter sp.]